MQPIIDEGTSGPLSWAWPRRPGSPALEPSPTPFAPAARGCAPFRSRRWVLEAHREKG